MEFSRKDFGKMKEGQVVTKLLETNVKHEVALGLTLMIDDPEGNNAIHNIMAIEKSAK